MREKGKNDEAKGEGGRETLFLSLSLSLEVLNSFNFAASARAIASDCPELANHKSSEAPWL